jgi:hypothetical protein
MLYSISYSQHCIALNNFNMTGNVSGKLQSKPDGIIMTRIFFIADMLEMTVRGKTVRAHMDRISKKKKYLTHRSNFLSKRTV